MNSRAWMIGILLIMAVICSSALALVNIKTAPIIERNNELTYMRTVLDAFGVAFDVTDSEKIIALFKERITEKESNGLTLFSENESGATAVNLTGGGFQGPISLIVALDGKTVKGFKVVNQKETPGLGARIMEDDFQRSFVGKTVGDGITMVKTGDAGPNEFDAITGATETSRALEKILNRGFDLYYSDKR